MFRKSENNLPQEAEELQRFVGYKNTDLVLMRLYGNKFSTMYHNKDTDTYYWGKTFNNPDDAMQNFKERQSEQSVAKPDYIPDAPMTAEDLLRIPINKEIKDVESSRKQRMRKLSRYSEEKKK